MNVNKSGVKSRLGFQRKQNIGSRSLNIGTHPQTSFKNFGTSGARLNARPFDARQKLTSKTGTVAGRILGSGRTVGTRSAGTKTQGAAEAHGLLQKTKFADARQRLELKRYQQIMGNDARAKLLAKRRFEKPEEHATNAPHQPSMQITVAPDGQKPQTAAANLQSYPVQVTLTAQDRMVRPTVSLANRTLSGSLKKTVVVNNQRGQQQQQQLTGSSASIGGLKRTFRTQVPQQLSSSSVDVDFGYSADALKSFKISFANDRYEEQQQRPIETIVTSRTARPVSAANQAKVLSAAASAAAKTAVPANATLKTTARSGITVTKTVVQPRQAAGIAVPSTSATPFDSQVRSSVQGYRLMVSNLHPDVTLDDVMELFSDIGPLKNARVPRPGVATVSYVRVEDALAAVRMYNTRELDGQPMSVKVTFEPPPPSSVPPQKPTIDLDIQMLHRALFKTVAEGSRPVVPVNFTVQL